MITADELCKSREQLKPVCWTKQKGVEGWQLKRETPAASVPAASTKPASTKPTTLQWKRTSAGWKLFRVEDESPPPKPVSTTTRKPKIAASPALSWTLDGAGGWKLKVAVRTLSSTSLGWAKQRGHAEAGWALTRAAAAATPLAADAKPSWTKERGHADMG